MQTLPWKLLEQRFSYRHPTPVSALNFPAANPNLNAQLEPKFSTADTETALQRGREA